MLARRLRRRFDLHKAMFILPNLFTVSSIFCGFYGVVTAASAVGPEAGAQLYRACVAVIFAMIFDALDGRVARLTRTQSEFGVQMDSLADVISFGAAPALIAWHWGLEAFGTWGLLACFVYTASGAIRLARFNVMAATQQGPSTHFIGLPIPAAAGLLVAVIIARVQAGHLALDGDELWAPIMMVVLGFFMISNIRFQTFKATRMTQKTFVAILVVFAMTVFVALRFRPSYAIVALMGSYLTLGLIEETIRFLKEPPEEDAVDPEEEELLD